MNPAEEYILDQSQPFREILLHLQMVIERTVPDMDLKYKYRIPYYYCESRPFCYMNRTKDYVDLGFWNAAHLTVHTELMVTAGRKVMKTLRYRSLGEIDTLILTEVLEDAYSVRNKKFYK
ncbi:MAG: DUF1801 domain-containing protein [Bacteroidota bacterium]